VAIVVLASLSTGSPAVAGSSTGEVVIRVTLEGSVPPTHSFAVRCGAVDPGRELPCFGPEDIVTLCTQPTAGNPFDDRLAPCAATTYEVVRRLDAGQTLEYALLRWTTPDLAWADGQPEEHLRGSWRVTAGRQVISLGFVYPDDAEPAGLPDTAIPAPPEPHRRP
jgi:hypothetical protein